jgi:hypothetical protein
MNVTEIDKHLKDVRKEYKETYGLYMEAERYEDRQNLYIDLLRIRDYYNRFKLSLYKNNFKFYHLN